MFVRKRAVQLKRHGYRSPRSSSLSINSVLRILSSLILPLTLGAFTLFITIYQHMSAKGDRREDLRRGDIQRNKDLERFEDQRREDRNESRIQREQELYIAKMSQEAKNKIAVNRYQNEMFKDYIKEISGLMKENNGSLTSNRLITALARVKTLNILRQLDGSRQTHVIRFLYETAKLTDIGESIAVVMKTAELTNINFQQITWSGKVENMSFPNINLRNCTFGERTRISFVDFTSTYFHHVNFSSTRLTSVDFSSANFRNTNFSSANIVNVSFASVIMSNTNFSTANFTDTNFSSATIWTTNFSSTVLRNVNFSSTSLANMNFSLALIDTITFSFAKLGAVNFSFAKLNDADFSSVQFADFPSSNFHHANMTHTIFEKCNCWWIDFSYAHLSRSVFWNANLKSALFKDADLTKANFSGANLWNADFTNTTITDRQLQSALSIQNAKLPNGTLGRGQNLIKNGDANCNIKSLHPWHVQNGSIAVVVSKENRNNCQFVLQSNGIGATMWQRINLVNAWDSTLWTNSDIELHLNNSSGVSIELNGLSKNGTVIQKKLYSIVE